MKRIITENISKDFRIGFKKRQTTLARVISLFSGKVPKKTLHALKNVSFFAESGEIVGIVGKNGSGKSTLLRILTGIYPIYKGSKTINGKIVPLIGLGVGLNTRLTMTENIFLVGSLFGLSQKDIKQRFNSMVEFSELGDFVNTKLYQFSIGMAQKLAFSIAIHCNPDILLLDEVFAVGDVSFRKKSAEKIKELVRDGATAIFVSHELWMVEKYCNRVIWMSKGEIVKQGETREVVGEYKNLSLRSRTLIR